MVKSRRGSRNKRGRRTHRTYRKRGGSLRDRLRRSSKYLPNVSKALCDREVQIRRGQSNYPKSRAGKLRHSLLKRSCYEKFPEYQGHIGYIGPKPNRDPEYVQMIADSKRAAANAARIQHLQNTRLSYSQKAREAARKYAAKKKATPVKTAEEKEKGWFSWPSS